MQTQIPLKKRFQNMPQTYQEIAHLYFYNIIPLMISEAKAISSLGLEASLEAFEGLIEEGGVQLIKKRDASWQVWLFNLITQRYENITTLKEELLEEELL